MMNPHIAPKVVRKVKKRSVPTEFLDLNPWHVQKQTMRRKQ